MKYFLIITLCFNAFQLFAQDTTYYDLHDNKVTSLENVKYYQIILRNQIDSNRVKFTSYFKSGQIKTEATYSDYKNGLYDGNLKEWFESGQIRRNIAYKDGVCNGLLLTYWDNKNPKRMDIYENYKFISGKCFSYEGKDTSYYDYEKMPEYPGGINRLLKYLSKEMVYPESAAEMGIQGKVLIDFSVEEDGSLSNIKINQSINPELDNEAIRVVRKMPKWKPGTLDGETFRVFYTLPLNFILQ